MGELSDRCQCCMVKLDERRSWRCLDCDSMGYCQVPGCGKCRLHCPCPSQMVISSGTGPVAQDRPYLSASQRSEALAEIRACDKCDLCEDHHQ